MLDWMQSHYEISEKGNRIHGMYKISYSPFWKPVIDWLSDITTKTVWVFGCRQSGKSTVGNAWTGYNPDEDPGPMKIIMPDEKTLKKRIKRLQTAFEHNSGFIRHLHGNIKNLYIGEVTTMDNMELFLGWPGSPVTLEDDPIRYLWGDEVRLWNQLPGENDIISVLQYGQRTFQPIAKSLFTTCPGTVGDLPHKYFSLCQKYSIHILCPHCGGYHEAMFENVEIDKDVNGKFYDPKFYKPDKKYKNRKPRARYVCPKCKSPWTEYERKAAVSECRACPEGCSIGDDGEIAGDYEESENKAITIPAVLLDMAFLTIEQLAADFVTAIKAREMGDISLYRSFWINQNARPWEEKERETSITILQSHMSDYRMGEVPRKVQIITHGIDVQSDHVWITTKGYGFRNESWLINAQKLETGNTGKPENWDIVEKYIRSPWFSQTNVDIPYYAMRAAVDCRYQRDEESTVVYDFCLKFPEGLVIPVMGYGRERMHNMPYKGRDVIGKALKRFDLNVDNTKDRSWQTLFNKDKQSGPGYMHLPANLPMEFLRQLASECQRVKRTRTGKEIVTWQKKEGFNENHLWDANGYADFAAELAGVFFLQDVDYVLEVMKSKKNMNNNEGGRLVVEKPIRTKY